MENVLNEINEVGELAKAYHDVSLNDLNVSEDSATFLMGENDTLVMVEFSTREDVSDDELCIVADIDKMYILLDVGSEKFVPVEVNLENQYAFVISAIEDIIGSLKTEERKADDEERHWDNMIEAYIDRQNGY